MLCESRILFTALLGKFIVEVVKRGIDISIGETYIQEVRAGIAYGNKQSFRDSVHMPNSLHYSGLAFDINLFVDGRYIGDSQHPKFKELGDLWLSLHPNCRWGGNFKNRDANHFSFAIDERA